MPQTMKGHRIQPVGAIPLHPSEVLTNAGDYYGPLRGYTGDQPAVFYLLPVARDLDAHGEARSIHHVVSPPHVFREEPDGTLTIRESIGAEPHWHGYLTRGEWRLDRGDP